MHNALNVSNVLGSFVYILHCSEVHAIHGKLLENGTGGTVEKDQDPNMKFQPWLVLSNSRLTGLQYGIKVTDVLGFLLPHTLLQRTGLRYERHEKMPENGLADSAGKDQNTNTKFTP